MVQNWEAALNMVYDVSKRNIKIWLIHAGIKKLSILNL